MYWMSVDAFQGLWASIYSIFALNLDTCVSTNPNCYIMIKPTSSQVEQASSGKSKTPGASSSRECPNSKISDGVLLAQLKSDEEQVGAQMTERQRTLDCKHVSSEAYHSQKHHMLETNKLEPLKREKEGGAHMTSAGIVIPLRCGNVYEKNAARKTH